MLEDVGGGGIQGHRIHLTIRTRVAGPQKHDEITLTHRFHRHHSAPPQGRCPIYVHRRVWEDNASPLKELARQENPVTGAGAAGKAPEPAAAAAAPAAPAEDPSPAAQLTSFKCAEWGRV